jgi:hypothetical protein
MEPLYDLNSELVGWIEADEHIFGLNMDWLAFLALGHAWSATTGNWLGPVEDLCCQDQSGRVVAWTPEYGPIGSARPPRPPRAPRAPRPPRPPRSPRPPRPPRPARPSTGWSDLSFGEWTAQ